MGTTRGLVGEMPDELWQLINGFRERRTLLTAIELDVFSALGAGASSEEVAGRLATDRRATDFLLHALAAMGLLEKHDDRFANTPLTTRFFVAGSPDDARVALLHSVNLWQRWSLLTECVRHGHPASWPDRNEEQTDAFIAAMHRGASLRAPSLVEKVGTVGVHRVIDVGGGSGAYAIAFAPAAPDLEAEVFDLASVVPIAEHHIAEAGLASRVKTRIGDLRRDAFGAGNDLVLLSSICHMLGPDENRDLFVRAHAALAPGGRLVVQDFLLNPDRTSPRQAALFALNMLVNTPSGGTYTEDEYRGWMNEAGFSSSELVPLPGPTNLVIGTHA